jgi:hypothetical protein
LNDVVVDLKHNISNMPTVHLGGHGDLLDESKGGSCSPLPARFSPVENHTRFDPDRVPEGAYTDRAAGRITPDRASYASPEHAGRLQRCRISGREGAGS